MDIDGPAVAELMADVATAVSRRAAAVSGQVYDVILRDIPELRGPAGDATEPPGWPARGRRVSDRRLPILAITPLD